MNPLRDLYTDLKELFTAPGLSRALVIALLICCLQWQLSSAQPLLASLHARLVQHLPVGHWQQASTSCPRQIFLYRLHLNRLPRPQLLLRSMCSVTTEGIETGLSFQALNGVPAMAATSTGGMVALQLPSLPTARTVTIGADNDPNDAGPRAALTAAQRWRDEGREVGIESPQGAKDWNDVLRAANSRAYSLQRLELLKPTPVLLFRRARTNRTYAFQRVRRCESHWRS